MTTRAPTMPLTLARPDPLPTEAEPDVRLLARLRAGDTQAAEALVLRYHRPLMGYLLRVGGQTAVAEELHQQTWLSVMQNAARFDDRVGGGFKAWLFRIATNKANDLWRRRRREAGDDALSTAPAPPSADRLEAAEDAARLRDAVAKLPEAQRQVLLMRYYGGLKFTEIADALGCPLNTALGRMHKAMLKLRELMNDETEDRSQEKSSRTSP
jgi:RNA polymerase sigma-70 factor (ECF subfamily)